MKPATRQWLSNDTLTPGNDDETANALSRACTRLTAKLAEAREDADNGWASSRRLSTELAACRAEFGYIAKTLREIAGKMSRGQKRAEIEALAATTEARAAGVS